MRRGNAIVAVGATRARLLAALVELELARKLAVDAEANGLPSYGPAVIDLVERACGELDRIREAADRCPP